MLSTVKKTFYLQPETACFRLEPVGALASSTSVLSNEWSPENDWGNDVII